MANSLQHRPISCNGIASFSLHTSLPDRCSLHGQPTVSARRSKRGDLPRVARGPAEAALLHL
jgi:hypothetical protein